MQLAGSTADVVNSPQALTPLRMAWLERLDRDASALLEHLSLRASQRLGLYFEQLWHFFLVQDPSTELIAHNLPVQCEGRTVGEFDCIYYCHQRRQYVHLELAVKFFLGYRGATSAETSRDAEDWLGPNTQDRLARKISHLLNRQIRLGDHPVAREQLKSMGIDGLLREMEIKGYLFQPLQDPLPPPPAYNPLRPFETWGPLDQLERFTCDSSAEAFRILPRARWLARSGPEAGGESLDADKLAGVVRDELNHGRSAVLVASMDRSGWEQGRFFVTRNGWPEN